MQWNFRILPKSTRWTVDCQRVPDGQVGCRRVPNGQVGCRRVPDGQVDGSSGGIPSNQERRKRWPVELIRIQDWSRKEMKKLRLELREEENHPVTFSIRIYGRMKK